jgi:hypothetical protein
MAESADATDLKSVGGDTVRVRPPLAPLFKLSLRGAADWVGSALLPYRNQGDEAIFCKMRLPRRPRFARNGGSQ